MIGAGRTSGDIPFFDQNGMNSPQRQVPSQSDAGDSAADDNNVALDTGVGGNGPQLGWRGRVGKTYPADGGGADAGGTATISERIRERLITREISIGDYVLTGGELPALVLIDALVRLLPGVLHDGTSLLNDSFQDGLLDAPQYTRPAEFREMRVPEVLLSGNHEVIERWRQEQRELRTRQRRTDLINEH